MACRRSGVRIPLAPRFFVCLFDKKTQTIGSGSLPDLRKPQPHIAVLHADGQGWPPNAFPCCRALVAGPASTFGYFSPALHAVSWTGCMSGSTARPSSWPISACARVCWSPWPDGCGNTGNALRRVWKRVHGRVSGYWDSPTLVLDRDLDLHPNERSRLCTARRLPVLSLPHGGIKRQAHRCPDVAPAVAAKASARSGHDLREIGRGPDARCGGADVSHPRRDGVRVGTPALRSARTRAPCKASS